MNRNTTIVTIVTKVTKVTILTKVHNNCNYCNNLLVFCKNIDNNQGIEAYNQAVVNTYSISPELYNNSKCCCVIATHHNNILKYDLDMPLQLNYALLNLCSIGEAIIQVITHKDNNKL